MFASHSSTLFRRRLTRFVLVVILLGAVVGLARKHIGRGIERMLRPLWPCPPTPTVAFVVPLNKAAGKQMAATARFAWKVAQDKHPFLKAVEFRCFDDKAEQSEACRLADIIARDETYIAVIGHFSSSVTKATLGAYGRGDVPLIMPVPTRTAITKEARQQGCNHVLRLPPTNEKQGEAAAEFALDKLGARTFGIFRDQDNPDYSNDLGRAFRDAVEKAGRGAVVFDLAAGGETSVLPVNEWVAKHEIDCLFVAGMTNVALQILRQAKAVEWRPKYTILTDGSMEEAFLVRGKDVIAGNIYFAFQLPDIVPKGFEVVQENVPEWEGLSFAPYGAESVRVLVALLESIDRDGKEINRQTVRAEIGKYLADPSKGIVGDLSYHRFDEYGNDQSLTYHFYQAGKTPFGENQFYHAPLCCRRAKEPPTAQSGD